MRQYPLNLYLTLILCLLFSASGAQSVIRGGSLSYKALDTSSYEVTAFLNIQCNGSGNYIPEIKCLLGNDTLKYDSMWVHSITDITGISPHCPMGSRCQGDTSTPYGLESHVYKAIFNRTPNASCEMLFFIENGQRVGTITTGQANQQFYIDTYLDHCLIGVQAAIQIGDDTFDNLVYCFNQDMIMANGLSNTAIEDSVSYELTNARISKNTSCTYAGNLSPLRPIYFFGFPNQNLQWPAGLRLDPLNGDFYCRPTGFEQIGTIVFEAKIWKKINGYFTVVAKIRKEKVVHIVSCPTNKTPKILPPYSKQICAGERACIQIRTDDDNTDDTVRISWNAGIPGATFTHNNGLLKHASGEICWTPDSSHISNIPYVIKVHALDDNCPLAGRSSRAFSFFVRESPRGTAASDILTCGFVAVSATPFKNYTGLSIGYYARDSSGLVVASGFGLADTLKLQPGRHILETQFRTSTPCFYSVYDTLDIPHYFIPTLGRSDSLCFADSFEVFVAISDTGTYSSEWTWKGSGGVVNMGDMGFSARLPLFNSQEIVVRLTDSTGCYNTDSIQVLADKVRLPIKRNYTLCEGTSLQIGNTQNFQGTYLWNTWSTSPTISVSEKGSYWLQLNYPNGCSSRDTILVVEQANPAVQLPGYQLICAGDPVQLNLSGFSNAYTFRWTIDDIPFGPNSPSISFFPKGSGILGVEVISPESCTGSAYMPYDVYEIPLNITQKHYQACADDPLDIGIDDDFPTLTYLWNTGEITPKIQVGVSGTYWIKTSDPYGCSRTDTFTLKLENPDIQFPDTLICEGVNNFVIPLVQGSRPFQYLWSDLSTDSVMQVSTGLISLLVTDMYGCTTYKEQMISFAPRPEQAFADTSVCQGTYLQALKDADSSMIAEYDWVNQWGGFYFMPGLSGTKILHTKSIDGCMDSFSYEIYVNNRPIPVFTWYSEGNTFYFTAMGIETQNSYRYDFGDSTFAYHPNSVKTYTTNGTYPVELTVTDTLTGCSDRRKFYIDAYALSEDEINVYGIKVSPNPFSQHIRLNAVNPCSENAIILITNSLGQIVYRTIWSGTEHVLLIDLSSCAIEKGIYMMSITCRDQIQRTKLIRE